MSMLLLHVSVHLGMMFETGITSFLWTCILYSIYAFFCVLLEMIWAMG